MSRTAKNGELSLGARVEKGGVFFRVWAPSSRKVEVLFQNGRAFPLRRESRGYHSGKVPGAKAGQAYWYRLDGGEKYPDPVSRFQPRGPHGPSQVVDPAAFRWTDRAWKGAAVKGQVIYELHVGTFTREGTLDAARRQLPELKRAGITMIEMMPVADFPGKWNWGYDGVDFFAPSRVYGDAEALKRFVNAAHRIGMAVILDVVYNHFGPDGNYLFCFSKYYNSPRHKSEWGPMPNYDGQDSGPVRDFMIQNACYWISEFHMDGLRLDATQSIVDSSREYFLAELSRKTRAAAGGRNIVLLAENEPQQTRLIRPRAEGGYGLDAVWADDFHHSARVALTGMNEAYFTDYPGKAQDILAAVRHGHLYQGQWYRWQKKKRGETTRGLQAPAFVHFLQNHDQIANYYSGERLNVISSPERYRALTALMLLSPATPLLFMGQEFGSTSPFPFFADHNHELAPLVTKGRKEFFEQFPSFKKPEAQKKIPDSSAPETFYRAKLDFSERRKNAPAYRFHKDLLALRKKDPVIARQSWDLLDGAVLNDQCFVLRYDGGEDGDRLLVVNLGPAFRYDPMPEPLMVSPQGRSWKLVLSSSDPSYTGRRKKKQPFSFWNIPGETTLFFTAHETKNAKGARHA
ncbi:MAG TPA: malto-oligosyltrehalose trehalohydrolase [Verrucomicrobiae bacterium]|jgi:maltooligosyltrehalose trehalohydrolase|nr:malto-oligosyltrehalose trehalohydrolase [Verrucomicrobiae bacterium]